MKLIYQISIVFGIMLFSEFICALFSLVVPPSIFGMILLLVLLLLKIIKPDDIKQVSSFLYKNMAFFIIPVTLSIMANYKVLAGKWLYFGLIVLFSTVMVFGATGCSVQLMQKLSSRKKDGEKH